MDRSPYQPRYRKFSLTNLLDAADVQADTIVSLLGFALIINASILTLAGAAYYYQNSDIDPADADLFGAHALIKSYIGNAAAVIFALALLCVSFIYPYPGVYLIIRPAKALQSHVHLQARSFQRAS